MFLCRCTAPGIALTQALSGRLGRSGRWKFLVEIEWSGIESRRYSLQKVSTALIVLVLDIRLSSPESVSTTISVLPPCLGNDLRGTSST